MYVTGMCKHMNICVPVHTRGGVDHQDPAASEGQGMSLLKAWRVQVCFISLDSIQPPGTPTPPVGVYTVGPWASCPPRVSLGHNGSHPMAKPWGRGRPVPCLDWATSLCLDNCLLLNDLCL